MAQVCYALTAVVDSVNDSMQKLPGLSAGSVISGELRYDTSSSRISPGWDRTRGKRTRTA